MDSSCWNVEKLRSEVIVVNELESILETAFNEQSGLYFGDFITLDYSTKVGAGSRNRDIGMEPRVNGQVACQVDDVTRDDLICRGKQIAKRWGYAPL